MSEPRIGLALGGGSARGLAHIPMLEVFDELGLRPSVIAGCSIGARGKLRYGSGPVTATSVSPPGNGSRLMTRAAAALRSRSSVCAHHFAHSRSPACSAANSVNGNPR